MDLEKLNEKAKAYDEVLAKPWNVLGYKIRQHNIKKHLATLGHNLRILDIGGGNGTEAIDLTKLGHQLDILDMSTEMLAQAKIKLESVGLSDKVNLHEGSVEAIFDLFEADSFDVILCHNVLQYLPDRSLALKAISFALKATGFSSIVCLNKYSEPMRLATQAQDIPAAKKALFQDTYTTVALGLPVALLSAEDIIVPATKTGLELGGHYGIRCVNDYVMDNSSKTPESSLDLELELTARFPYYLLARFFQLIFLKGVRS